MFSIRSSLVLTLVVLVKIIESKESPSFLGSESNVTVVLGRDATLTCKVDNLQHYTVAWLRVDTQTILTIGGHVITKNHRVSTSRTEPQSWALTLRDVRPTDGGSYMCQINTEPMLTQTHHLQVVVPPDIVDSDSSGEVMVREGDNVSLHCAASGAPTPNITWRREDTAEIQLGTNTVPKWNGVWLNMTNVHRTSNGVFLCIATNGVPPSVSKRIILHVLCAPTVWAVQKMLGGFIGNSVTIQCRIEAYPQPAVIWTHTEDNRLQNGTKYQTNITSDGHNHIASLTIHWFSREDIGLYQCTAENNIGKSRADVTLYTLATTTTTTTTTSTTSSTASTTTVTNNIEVSSTDTHPDVNFHNSINDIRRKFAEDDNFVVVLSQHQMQNLDLSPSL